MSEIQLARAVMPVTVLKAEADGDRGVVEAIVSAYDVRYRMGFFSYHLLKPGTFADSIAEQAAIPMFWMHNWDWTEQPPIGHGTASEVTSPKPGLKIAGELYLDQPGVPSIFRALKAGALREWSIGYRILESSEDPDDDAVKIITKAELLEASSVLRGANPETETLKVASFAPASLQRIADALGAASTELHRLLDLDGSSSPVEEATACPVHHTGTVEGTWDAGVHVGRLPSPMSVATARRMYAWYDAARVENGQIVKAACSLPHHEVSEAGVPGAANLNGVRNALSRLPQSNIPTSDHAAVRTHLQVHLDDAPGEDADRDVDVGAAEVDDFADAKREITAARNQRRVNHALIAR